MQRRQLLLNVPITLLLLLLIAHRCQYDGAVSAFTTPSSSSSSASHASSSFRTARPSTDFKFENNCPSIITRSSHHRHHHHLSSSRTSSSSSSSSSLLSSPQSDDIIAIDYDDASPPSLFSPPLPSTSFNAANKNDMQALGNKLILQAALEAGATEAMIDVEWKAERIIVLVDVHNDDNYGGGEGGDGEGGEVGEVWMGDYLDEDLEEVEMMDGDDYEEEEGDYEAEGDDDDDDDVEEYFNEEEDEEEFNLEGFEPVASSEDAGAAAASNDNPSDGRIDLTLIARNINILLAQDGEDSLAFEIARMHSIEVTTPEFDNVLRGNVMFENYKGFDVEVEHWEEVKVKKKKKKGKAQKTAAAAGGVGEDGGEEEGEEELPPPPKLTFTEGKLVGRDYEKGVTMINVRGRVKKIKNDAIEKVTLPKAKHEKGVK